MVETPEAEVAEEDSSEEAAAPEALLAPAPPAEVEEEPAAEVESQAGPKLFPASAVQCCHKQGKRRAAPCSASNSAGFGELLARVGHLEIGPLQPSTAHVTAQHSTCGSTHQSTALISHCIVTPKPPQPQLRRPA